MTDFYTNPDRKFACTKCDLKFKSLFHLNRHIDSHKSFHYKCTTCKMDFWNNRTLEMHREYAHRNVDVKTELRKSKDCRQSERVNQPQSSKELKCHKCNFLAANQASYKRHLKSHRYFFHRCPMSKCPMEFRTFKELSAHQHQARHLKRIVTEKTSATIVKKESSSKINKQLTELLKKIEMAALKTEKSKPVEFVNCDETSEASSAVQVKSELQTQPEDHDNFSDASTQPYYSASEADSEEDGGSEHENSVSDNIWRIKADHGVIPPMDSSFKCRYSCTKCDAKIWGWRNFQAHFEAHTGKLECDICKREFPSRILLRKHKSYHKDDRYTKFTCDIGTCRMLFNTNSGVKWHKDKVHNIGFSDFEVKREKHGNSDGIFKQTMVEDSQNGEKSLNSSRQATNASRQTSQQDKVTKKEGNVNINYECCECQLNYSSNLSLWDHLLETHIHKMKNNGY